jgi:cytochrome P450
MSIPSVPGLPVLGNLHEYRLDKIGFLSRLRNAHPDPVRFRLGRHTLILITRPEDIHWVEMKNARNYVKATNFRSLVGDGILMSEGEKWKKQRRLIAPTFHPGSLTRMVEAMNGRIIPFFNTVREGGGRPIDLCETMKRLAFQIVGDALFGSELGHGFEELRESMIAVNRILTRRFSALLPLPDSFPTPSNLRFKSALTRIDRIVHDLIDKKALAIRNGTPGEDLLTKMMLARDPDTGQGMDPVQLRDEALSMLLAGFETTGHLLPWIFHELSREPRLQEELSREIDQRIGERIPDLETASSMPLLGAIIDETLRLYPPVWAWTKRALEDDEIRGHRLRSGAILYLSPYLTHRDPLLWKDPDSFRPDRWTPELREKMKTAFFPFGMGPRTCVGRHFALLEIKLILIHAFREWRVERHTPAETREDFQITLGMKTPLLLRFRRRGH